MAVHSGAAIEKARFAIGHSGRLGDCQNLNLKLWTGL